MTPNEHVGPCLHCRVRKVLQLEGGRCFRTSCHSGIHVGNVCQHKKRDACGVREHRVCEFSDSPREPHALDQAVGEARRAAEIVGDGGGVT